MTLQEGGTPLIPCEGLSELTGANVFVKFEGLNPTASFKDRGMTTAMSMAKKHGAKAVICASTGNTSASAAAYATKAGMTCAVLVPGRFAKFARACPLPKPTRKNVSGYSTRARPACSTQ